MDRARTATKTIAALPIVTSSPTVIAAIYNLRADPFERGPESMEYGRWQFERVFFLVPAQAFVAQWLQSFKEFPMRQTPASFNLDEVMQEMSAPKN